MIKVCSKSDTPYLLVTDVTAQLSEDEELEVFRDMVT